MNLVEVTIASKLLFGRSALIIGVLFSITGVTARAATSAPCDEALPPAALVTQQKALVEALDTHVKGLLEEERIGQRTVSEVLIAYEEYHDAAELFNVMKKCGTDKGATGRRELLKVRIQAASQRQALYRELVKTVTDRWQVGEVTKTDVAGVQARALKAEIRLQTLERETKKK
jgi:hypothetical protein